MFTANDVREWLEAYDNPECAYDAIVQAAEEDRLAKNPCGHPAACVTGSDEGTQYCEMCQLESRAQAAELEKKEQAQKATKRIKHYQSQIAKLIDKNTELEAKLITLGEALRAYQTMRNNDGYTYTLSEIDDIIDQALSITPRILSRRAGTVEETQRYYEDEWSSYEYFTKEIAFEDGGEPLYLGTDLDEELQFFQHGLKVEVLIISNEQEQLDHR
jgi:hypothetical protein